MKFVYFSGGLGDICAKLSECDVYDRLRDIQEPVAILMGSLNPGCLEIFRYHPNNQKLVLMDMGHVFARYNTGANSGKYSGQQTKDIIQEVAGFRPEDELWCDSSKGLYVLDFDAPDKIHDSHDHVVIHPFAVGLGPWPEGVLRRVLDLSNHYRNHGAKFKIICASHTRLNQSGIHENIPSDLTHWESSVVRLSAPAAFSLTQRAKVVFCTFSCLSQVVGVANKKICLIYPPDSDDIKKNTDYVQRAMRNPESIKIAYDEDHMFGKLEEFLRRTFL